MDLGESDDTELLKEMIDRATVNKIKTLRSKLGQLKQIVKDLSLNKEGRGQSGCASTAIKKSTKK